ncbi:hypothetical protein ScPMuIL_015163 [Solemya velum]
MNLLCSRGGMEEDSTKKKVPIGAWPEADKPVRDEKTGLFGLYLQEARSKQNERVDALLRDLGQGTILHKVKSGGILYPRNFFIDPKSVELKYTGSEKRIRRAKTSWPISKIREVREGDKDYSKRLDPYDRSRCFVVIFGANQQLLYLLAENSEERNKWVKGLRYAVHLEQYLDQKHHTDKYPYAFNMADKNGNGSLDFEEVMRLLKRLNADMDRKYVKQLFDKADAKTVKGEKPSLDREEFIDFYHMLTERPEIEELFLKYADGKGYLNAEDLHAFLVQEQKVKVKTLSMDTVREHIIVFEPQEDMKKQELLSLIGFTNLMISEEQQILNPAHRKVYHDMSQPMTHYFINSSHNTYLTDDQLKGPSKVEAYIRALSKGCRCVELDCWDGTDNEPVIYHGHTLTSKIRFYDVICAIRDYSFKASPYPVVLSIENHCSIGQQAIMARHLHDILGELLYAPEQPPERIPTPNQLRGRIVLKGKKLPKAMFTQDTEPRPMDDEVSDEDEAAEMENENASSPQKVVSKEKIKLSTAFSAVVAMKAIGFRTLDQAISSKGVFTSLGESKVEKMMDTNMEGVNKLSQKMIVRTYPSGSRTDSSNYNPIKMWCAGCQVVALNYQTGGLPMQLLHGKFIDNGNCGFILKPQYLLDTDRFGVVTGKQKIKHKRELIVTVVSGYQLPKPRDSKKGEVIDPFVKIEIHGAGRDTQDQKTSVIHNNGFKPRWDETFHFSVGLTELAIMRFAVFDHDRTFDDFIGYYCLPLNSMQEGYRQVPLYDKYGDCYSQALLLVHIAFADE